MRSKRNGEGSDHAPWQGSGDPGQVVRHVAGLLGRFGERLKAGDVIISGSLTSVVWVEPEDRVEVAFDSLGKLEASFGL